MNHARIRTMMIALCFCSFLSAFMVSGVGAILPTLGRALSASAANLSLVSAIYVLSLTIFNVVAAQLIARFGQRRVFLGGFALFLTMCTSLALSPNVQAVWVQRFVQGAGAAMVATSSITLMLSAAPRNMQGRFMGLLTAATYLGIALGPLVGGGIATLFGWRWLFAGLVPLGLGAWVVLFRSVKVEWTPNKRGMDYPGILLLGLALLVLTMGASNIGRNAYAGYLLGAGGVGLLLFCAVEAKVRYPVVDVRFIVKHPPLILGLFAAFVNFGATNGLLFYYMLYLQQLRFLSPFQAGAFVAMQSVVQSLLSPLGGKLCDRFGPDPVAAAGLGFAGLGIYLSSGLNMETPLYYVAACQCVIGVGLALFAGPNTISIVRSVDSKHMAEASGLANTLRNMGALFSLIVVSATMTRFLGENGASPEFAEEFLKGMRLDLLLFSALNILGLLLVSLRILNAIRCRMGKGVDCVPDAEFFAEMEQDSIHVVTDGTQDKGLNASGLLPAKHAGEAKKAP